MSEQRFPIPYVTTADALASAQIIDSLAADLDAGRWEFVVDPWIKVRSGPHVVIPFQAWMKIEAALKRHRKYEKAPTAQHAAEALPGPLG